jgi:hypothetical protein
MLLTNFAEKRKEPHVVKTCGFLFFGGFPPAQYACNLSWFVV